jgi:hypothetical protein
MVLTIAVRGVKRSSGVNRDCQAINMHGLLMFKFTSSASFLVGWNDKLLSDAFHVIWRWTDSSVEVYHSNVALVLVQWPLMRSKLGVQRHRILEDNLAIDRRFSRADTIEAIPQEVVWMVCVLGFAFFQATEL